MERPKQFREGYQEYTFGSLIDENPYDRSRHPEQFKAWKAGWKQAKFDSEHANS